MDQPNRPDRRDPEGSGRGEGESRGGRAGGSRPYGSAAGRPDRSGPVRRGPRPEGRGGPDRGQRPDRGTGSRDDRPARDDRPPRDDRAPRDDRYQRDDRPARDDRAPRGDDRGSRSPRTDRYDRGPRDDRPARDDRYQRDDRPPRSDRPDRAAGGRPAAARPASGRPTESRGARGSREPRPWDDRPARSGPPRGDRPDRGGRPDRGDRPDRGGRPDRGSRPERGGRPDRPGADRRGGPAGDDRRPPRRDEPPRPGLARKADEPPIPEGVDVRELHRAARAELRGLPKELAEIVASHLVVAGQMIEADPDLAYRHAEAARRRAARLPLVREAAAETAYASGRWDVALSEYRALRRMTGTDDYLPVMADCERALGRPDNALKLAREADRLELDPALRIEMTIVESGARRDLGQGAEARRLLERAVQDQTVRPGLQGAVARLRYAFAEALLQDGEPAEARRWFVAAAKLDPEQETDAALRVDEIDGLRIDFDEDDDEDEDDGPAPQQAGGRDRDER